MENFTCSWTASKQQSRGLLGPMALATCTLEPLNDFPWVQECPYCHQMMTQTNPRANRMLSEKVKFSKFAGATEHPANSTFGAFQRPISSRSVGPHGCQIIRIATK